MAFDRTKIFILKIEFCMSRVILCRILFLGIMITFCKGQV